MPTRRADFWCASVSSTRMQREGGTFSVTAMRRSMRASGLGRRSPNIVMRSIGITPWKSRVMPSAASTRSA